ncbi:hypothetical protein EMIT0P74_10072 [Pseudomonas sp. IT-P74]
MLEKGRNPQHLLSLLLALAANGALQSQTNIGESPKKSPHLFGPSPASCRPYPSLFYD